MWGIWGFQKNTLEIIERDSETEGMTFWEDDPESPQLPHHAISLL